MNIAALSPLPNKKLGEHLGRLDMLDIALSISVFL
jgi:hypothetical protein